jgi:hypothetical protein
VISAHNDNTKPYNLTAVVASLNSPMDFSMHIQNFTHQVGGGWGGARAPAAGGRAHTHTSDTRRWLPTNTQSASRSRRVRVRGRCASS